MEETLGPGLVRGEARDTVQGAIGVEMGCGMKPGLVGSKNSKAYRDTGDGNDKPPPIFCLGLRRGRRGHTLTHACPYAYMLTQARLNTVEAPCACVVSSTHFLLHEVAPLPTTPKSLQPPILPFCTKDKGETLPVSKYLL